MTPSRVESLCDRHAIEPARAPEPMPFSSRTWLVEDSGGGRWVIKLCEENEAARRHLRDFSVLHPPFLYPRPLDDAGTENLLYPYLPGEIAAEADFESEEAVRWALETAARVQALARSLVLASQYEEALRPRGSEAESLERFSQRHRLGATLFHDEKRKRERLEEAALSRTWTVERTRRCCQGIRNGPGWPEDLLAEFRERMEKAFSIHLPVFGNNLAHTDFHPEHLLRSPDGAPGVTGWRIGPRPRFFMIHTYLAWSLLHSRRPRAVQFYSDCVEDLGRKAFFQEHHLVAAFCVLDRLVLKIETEDVGEGERRVEEAGAFFASCMAKLRGKTESSGF